MKKYLLILTTLALLGGGCSKEEIPETTDGEGSVEFRTTTCSEVDSQRPGRKRPCRTTASRPATASSWS